jgi:hypothetical protein
MSLLDFIAAAGEEFLELRALGAGTRPVDAAALRRLRRRFLGALMVSLLALGGCWELVRLWPASRRAPLAAVGVYAALSGALLSALGWAYAWAGLSRATLRRGRDA